MKIKKVVAVVLCCIMAGVGQKFIKVEDNYDNLQQIVLDSIETYLSSENLNAKVIQLLEKDNDRHIVTGTIYNPVCTQCDDDPFVTADQSIIDIDELNNGNLKWIAISRELRQFYPYGCKVKITSFSDPEINGIYEVHDTMNKRFSRKIDFLMPCDVKLGKWENLIIEKV